MRKSILILAILHRVARIILCKEKNIVIGELIEQNDNYTDNADEDFYYLEECDIDSKSAKLLVDLLGEEMLPDVAEALRKH